MIPRKGDKVEMGDLSRLFGVVIGFRKGGKYVRVRWDDGKVPKICDELPSNLALVNR